MRLPKLTSIEASRSTVDVFGGYNHNLRIADGSWYDMKNMSSDLYPLMTPRDRRGVYLDGQCNGLVSNNGLCYVTGEYFVLPDGTQVDLGLERGVKTLVSMGAYVIILPDKKWINVASYLDGGDGESGDIEASCLVESITACMANGERFEDLSIEISKPEAPSDGQLWLDKTVWPPVLKEWYASANMWVEKKSYVRLESSNIDKLFSVGDGLTHPMIEIEGTVASIFVKENRQVLATGDGYLVVEGVVTKDDISLDNPITVQRKMPDADFIIESGNRLWGCKYGVTDSGFINEIYASKLGDFKNWNSFQGVSTDSYRASVGADGEFTGAVNYGGKPFFFKENCLVEVYGAYPAQYQVQTVTCNGVQKGSENSLVVVNNVLYYKATTGVCAFDGSLPTVISSVLGQEYYHSAVAGTVNNKYYISMINDAREGNLFVLDTAKGLWHKEDDLIVRSFCKHGNELYAVSDDGAEVITMLGSGTQNSDPVEWMVQSGDIGISLPDAKYVTRLVLRLSMKEGSEMSVYTMYDFEEEWRHLCTIPSTHLRRFDIPIRPVRCDYMRIRIEGVGPARIYSITKTIEQGSDVT